MEQRKNSVFGLIAIVILLVGGLVLLWHFLPSPDHKPSTPVATSTAPTSTIDTVPRTKDGITQTMCEAARGHWNACASPCRNKPGEICIQVCQPECECGGIAGWQCPVSSVCTDYVPSAQTPDAMGVCRPIGSMSPTTTAPISTTTTVIDVPERRKGMLCDESDSICVPQSLKDQLIGNPFVATGTAYWKTGALSWKFIEGNGAREIMSGTLRIDGDDRHPFGSFQIREFFPATYVPATTEGTLEISEVSEFNGKSLHVLRIPMKLSRQTATVNIHAVAGDGKNCSETRPIRMNIPRTSLPVEASIRRLLELRPTKDNPEQMTTIPQGTKLISLSLSNGVLRLVFSRELENYGGGSCNVAAIRAQIEKTAKESSAVRQVEISVEGKTSQETLQP